MIRWLWRGVLAAVALVTIAAQLDRATHLRPELSIMVPKPFRSFAQPTTALAALAAGDADAARDEARVLVRRRPLPAEHLFILAMAEMRGKQDKTFAAAFRAASTRGWRFAPLQTAAAQAALANGDIPAAANRVAALWAADAQDPAVPALTRALLEAPGGPEAFAIPLAGTKVWGANFLTGSPAMAPPSAIVRTVRAARSAGARFDCSALETLARTLATRDAKLDTAPLACS